MRVKLAKPVKTPDPPSRIYLFSTALKIEQQKPYIEMRIVESITAFRRAQPSDSPFLNLEQPNLMNFFGKRKALH